MVETKVEAKGLNLYYGDFHALKNINLDIAVANVTALIGPSGCGKSTFLRTINRMNDLIEGTKIVGDLLIDGNSIYSQAVDVVLLRKTQKRSG